MNARQGRSFTEVAILEATARRAHVDLVLRSIADAPEKHLVSRFLGTCDHDDLVLDMPLAKGRKVFVSAGRKLGMAFAVGQFLLQGRTKVLGHCQFPLHPTRRVDGLVVARPPKMTPTNRRVNERNEVDPLRHVVAWVWSAEALQASQAHAAQIGLLSNWSGSGLGIKFGRRLPYNSGSDVIIRLDSSEPGSDDLPLYSAALKHCTLMREAYWLAGFGDVAELRPGQAPAIVEALAVELR